MRAFGGNDFTVTVMVPGTGDSPLATAEGAELTARVAAGAALGAAEPGAGEADEGGAEADEGGAGCNAGSAVAATSGEGGGAGVAA